MASLNALMGTAIIFVNARIRINVSTAGAEMNFFTCRFYTYHYPVLASFPAY